MKFKMNLIALSAAILISFTACGEGADKTEYEGETKISAEYAEKESKPARGQKGSYEKVSEGGSEAVYNYSCVKANGEEVCGKVYILKLEKNATREDGEKTANEQGVGEYDFAVLDYTYLRDACFQVRNSYRADDYYMRATILDILTEYDACHRGTWRRTRKSTEAEWVAHNIAYAGGYEIERARHVDLNNDDEEKYLRKSIC